MNIGIRLFFFDPFFQFLHLFFPFQHQFEKWIKEKQANSLYDGDKIL